MTDLTAILRDGSNVAMTKLRNYLATVKASNDDQALILATGTIAALVESRIYDDQSSLFADLDHDADLYALVTFDADPAKKGLYKKVGATGTGSWSGPSTLIGDAASAAIADDLATIAADRAAAEDARDQAAANTLAYFVDAPITDDGLIPIEIDQDNRIIRGRYADGTLFDPLIFPDVTMDDDGLLPLVISDESPPRVLSGRYPDGSAFPQATLNNEEIIFPNDLRLTPSNYAQIGQRDAEALSFIRPIADGYNIEYNAPGARVTFWTTAAYVTLEVEYNFLVEAESDALTNDDDLFVVRVDGVRFATFSSSGGVDENVTETETIDFGSTVLRRIDLIWPYSDNVRLKSLRIPAGAGVAAHEYVYEKTIIWAGESLPHGFNAPDIERTYAFQVCDQLNYRMINLANGGALINAANGTLVGEAAVPYGEDAIITLNIGINNCIAQTPIATFKASFDGWIDNARAAAPDADIMVQSPFFAGAGLESLTIALDDYRTAISEVVAAITDAKLFFEDGLAMVTNNLARLSADETHLNATGSDEAAVSWKARIIANLT